jgi:outer membrane protein assembly factor BamB
VKSLVSTVRRAFNAAGTGPSRHSDGGRRSLGGWVVVVPVSLLLSGLLLVGVLPAASPVAAICTVGCGYGDWPTFHSNTTRTGVQANETKLSTSTVGSMTEAWTGAVGGNIQSNPAIVSGVVYVGSANGKLFAFAAGCAGDDGTCNPLWTATTGGSIKSSPAVVNGVVYVGSADDKLYAFDAAGPDADCSGTPRVCTPLWTATTAGIVDSSPAVSAGVVYVGSEDSSLYAFDAAGVTRCSGVAPSKTCLPIWTGVTGFGIGSSPSVSGGVVYVGSEDHKLYAFNVGCGSGGAICSPAWTATTNGAVFSAPAVTGGAVYVGTNNGTLYAYDAAGVTGCSGVAPARTCTALWTGATTGFIYDSPAVANGVVYVGATDDKLYAFAVGCASGGNPCSPLWTGTTGNQIVYSSPAVANGVVYIGSRDNKLYAFAADGVTGCSAGSCSPLWTDTLTGGTYWWDGSPAISNGVLYAGAADFKLHAFYVALDHLVLSPASASIAAGGSQAYTAEGFDAFNNDLGDVTGATTIHIDASQPCVSHVCTSSVVGSHTVTGVDGSATGVATLNVTAGPLDHLVLSPSSATMPAGGSQSYTAEGFDALNNDLGDVTGATTITIDSGTACPAQTCTSSTPGFHTVTGTDGAATGTASLHVWIGDTYHPITPIRLLDTRHNNGWGNSLMANTPITFPVTLQARPDSTVPSGATAVTGNITVTGSTFSWAVYLGPDPVADPGSSTINFNAGETTANGLTVALSNTGTLSATYLSTAGNTTDLVFDVTGYFTSDSSGNTYHPMTPARLLDTRNGNGLTGGIAATIHSNTPLTFTVAGRDGVPADATAVTGNVTVVDETNSWAIYVGPDPVPNPTTSTLNFLPGDIKANNLTVALGAGGTLSATYMSTTGQTTDLVFDVTGYYTADLTGARFEPLTPARLLDTRVDNGLSGKLLANTPRPFTVAGRGGVPTYASAVTGNVTVVNETFSWAIYVGPDPIASPSTSTLNFNVGDIKANGLTVSLGSGGSLALTYMSVSGNDTDVVFDVTGYYVP